MLVKIPGRRTSFESRPRLAKPDPDPARRAVPVVDLGPGQRDERARQVQHRHRCPGLLLRPVQSLQRGSNENTNGLLRQYFPKASRWRTSPQADLGRRRSQTQRQTSTNPELDDTVTETCPSVAMTVETTADRCGHRRSLSLIRCLLISPTAYVAHRTDDGSGCFVKTERGWRWILFSGLLILACIAFVLTAL